MEQRTKPRRIQRRRHRPAWLDDASLTRRPGTGKRSKHELRAQEHFVELIRTRMSVTKIDLIDINAITEQFGLMFQREEAGFNHNLRTAVVDAQGKVQKAFIGNEWKVEDLVEEIVKAAAAK